MRENNDDFSFVGEGKENFKARLQQLIGTRSVRAAAGDWGVPVSTLNNYLHKGTEPSFKVVCLISNKEQVSLNWLAYGRDDAVMQPSSRPAETINATDNDLANELLRRAHPADKEKLVNAICDIGIKGILSKLQQPEAQHSQPEREYTREEQEAMLRALPISEKVKNTASLALALGDDANQEILEILDDVKRRFSPEGGATSTPDQSLKQKAG
ncbi:helix-turn-helix domain-containing protein [Salmonella enterica]|uniref:helix-turn-helix domain-containing protein n=1 Tax=Salmonella enterica TaxID=28901 RepID=UPI0003BD940D|nr:helix-turn-helix domain-containing protein [Salmonella enterica]AUM42005.1 hypothetical protein SEEP1673_019925 [Salmonella enterica subsp. enterica serovar Poona str. ATCC BAA-1673]EJB1365942.1 helix-turn-helix domain-containing protein [Salmonella enterica]EKC9721093.1 helix-turn-helix domain-containing protein [Salmonella enterica]